MPRNLRNTANTRNHEEPHGNFVRDHGTEEEWSIWPVIRLACIRELGYAYIYMMHIHPDVNWEPQYSRVTALMTELGRNQKLDDLNYWRHFFTRIIDEIENMC